MLSVPELAPAESHPRGVAPPSGFPRRDTGRAVVQQNVELVREIIAAVPDWHEVSAMLHPDIRFDQTRIPDGGVYEGREACGRFFERWFGTWDEIRMTPERFIEDGDRVLALMRIEGRGKGSGVPVVIRSADLFTIRDGKIVSLVGYPDRAEALATMGLSE
jgi:ketosteroid isomerase-like protein